MKFCEDINFYYHCWVGLQSTGQSLCTDTATQNSYSIMVPDPKFLQFLACFNSYSTMGTQSVHVPDRTELQTSCTYGTHVHAGHSIPKGISWAYSCHIKWIWVEIITEWIRILLTLIGFLVAAQHCDKSVIYVPSYLGFSYQPYLVVLLLSSLSKSAHLGLETWREVLKATWPMVLPRGLTLVQAFNLPSPCIFIWNVEATMPHLDHLLGGWGKVDHGCKNSCWSPDT